MSERSKNLSLKELGVRLAQTTTALSLAVMLDSTPIASADQLVNPDPNSMNRVYTQCGSELLPTSHVVLVTEYSDSDLTSRFLEVDFGPLPNVCGNDPFPEPEDMVSPLNPNQPVGGTPVSLGDVNGVIYPFSRTYLQCGGLFYGMALRANHTILVDEFKNATSDQRMYSIRDIGSISGQCNNS